MSVRTSVFAVGVVILAVGLVSLLAPGFLVGGIVIAIIGAIVAVVGATTGRPREYAAPPPRVTEPAAGPMDSMVKMLAEAPESQRREMIRTRLSSFAEMNDSERANGMKMMMGALQKLDPEGLRRITATRLTALAEDFDATTRKKLIGTHMMVLMGLPKEQMMTDISAMVFAMTELSESSKMKVMGTMKELMMEMPQDKRSMMMQMLPPEVQKMLMA